jgi:hypothetical protein
MYTPRDPPGESGMAWVNIGIVMRGWATQWCKGIMVDASIFGQ